MGIFRGDDDCWPFVACRIGRRRPLEETDRGIAERWRAELLAGPEALDGYLLDTS